MQEYIFIKVIYRTGKIEYYGKKLMQIVVNSDNQISDWTKRYAYHSVSTAKRYMPILEKKLEKLGIKYGQWRVMSIGTLTCFEDNN